MRDRHIPMFYKWRFALSLRVMMKLWCIVIKNFFYNTYSQFFALKYLFRYIELSMNAVGEVTFQYLQSGIVEIGKNYFKLAIAVF